jgi:hypothetical protein
MLAAVFVWVAAFILLVVSVVGVNRARPLNGSPVGYLLMLIASFWLGGLGVGLAIAAASGP